MKTKFKINVQKIYSKIKDKTSKIQNIVANFLQKLVTKLHLGTLCKKIGLEFIYKKLKKVDKKIYTKAFALTFYPICIFLFSQFFCNGKLIFEFPRMLINFIFIYFIIGFFYFIFGKLKTSLYITMTLTFIVGIINHFITVFRGTPLVPWDIFSLNVALTVLPTFKFSLTRKAIIGIFIFIISMISLHKLKLYSFTNNSIKKIYRLIVFISSVAFTICFLTTNMISIFNLDENWDPKEEYHNNGLIASLFKQSRNLIITKPENYDIEAMRNLASTIDVPIVEHNEDYEYPNIIAIMNESFADLSVISDFSTNEDYMPFYRSLSKNAIKGNLHTSIFGATTPNSEWEFLTSNSMAFVPKRTVPYQQYVLRKSYSLASILNQQGYSTSAIHCYYPQGYNRNLAYPRLGFDAFFHINNLKDLAYVREYPDDLSTYKNIISIFENKSDDEKIFNFTLTMQNHGSYTDENFASTIIAENGQYPRLNQYLSLIKIADESLEYLLNYFSNFEEPTIIVLFGDHQPYVEDEFYKDLLQKEFTDISSKEAAERKYITPFLIWANYDIDTEKYSSITDMSANYLASLVLDIANIQKTPYLQFLDELRTEIPIITGNGYMDKTGIYHDFSEETEYSDLIENYRYLQFNNMFDKADKLTSLFEIPLQVLEN